MALPRMRTISGAYEEIKANDPNTGITRNYVYYLAKSGAIATIKRGNKTLLNLDMLIALIEQEGTSITPIPADSKPYGKLRAIAE